MAAAEAAVSASGAQPSEPPPPRTEPDVDKNIINNLISRIAPETEILQLDTGKEGEKLIGFYRIEGSGFKQGGIIMFPDQKTHLDWPEDMNYLREGLAEYGWHTLAIYLPQEKEIPIPKRTLPVMQAITPSSTTEGEPLESEETEEATEEAPAIEAGTSTESTEPVAETAATEQEPEPESESESEENYEEIIFRLGQTAIKHLEQQGLQRFVVLGVGTGATWAAQYVQKHQETQDLRLLMVDARNPEGPDAPNLMKILPEIKDTIMDLHHTARVPVGQNLQPEAPERRMRLARHKRMNNFHQSRMPATRDNWKKDQTWLLKHVRGILNTYVIKAEQNQRSFKLNAPAKKSAEAAPGG